jgi:hypothetical protein
LKQISFVLIVANATFLFAFMNNLFADSFFRGASIGTVAVYIIHLHLTAIVVGTVTIVMKFVLVIVPAIATTALTADSSAGVSDSVA